MAYIISRRSELHFGRLGGEREMVAADRCVYMHFEVRFGASRANAVGRKNLVSDGLRYWQCVLMRLHGYVFVSVGASWCIFANEAPYCDIDFDTVVGTS